MVAVTVAVAVVVVQIAASVMSIVIVAMRHSQCLAVLPPLVPALLLLHAPPSWSAGHILVVVVAIFGT